MGTGEEGPPARRGNGLKRRRWVDEEDDDDEEYVVEEEEEEDEEDYAKELSASSAGEGGKDSDEEYEGEEEEEYEVETPRPRRPLKGGRKGKTDPAAARSKRRRYEEDDDYEEEPDEDEEYHEEEEEAPPRPKSLAKFGRRDWNVELARPGERSHRRRQEDDTDFDPELDDEDSDPELDDVEDEIDEEEEEVVPRRPKSQVKCGGHDWNVELAVPAERSHRQRQEEDMDFNPELDDEDFDPELDEKEEELVPPRPKSQAKCGGRDQNLELAVPAERSHQRRQEEDMDFDPELDDEDDEVDEDIDFDPELDDEDEFADEEEEEVGAIRARKVTVKNPAKRKSVAKRGSLKKKKKKNSGSKVSRRSSSGKRKKPAPARRRRKRSMIEDYEEEDDFIVDDEVVANRHPKKKARTGTALDPPVSVIDEETWPNVDSDTSDFEFVTSDEEPDDVETAVVGPVAVKKRRKKRVTVSDSSSDSEFVVSDKELEDLRETEPLKTLPTLLALTRRISITRHGEDKGKKKQEPEEAVKPICGICLSEEQRATVQGVLNCCSHYFCFACIMEWSRVESRCPLCKQRFTTITKASKLDLGLGVRKSVIKVEERDQVYQPSEEEIRRWLDPYENVVCIECNQGGDDSLMLLCDICDSSAHTFCVGLGREVPEGNWYCGGCRLNDEGPSYTRTQHTSGYERQNYRNHVGGSNVGFGMAAQSRSFERSPPINSRRSLQGFDLNLSPREAPGEIHPAESQASTDGVSTPGMRGTVSGRRQIHRYIRILLTRPRPPTSIVQPRTEPRHHNFRSSSEANTSQIVPDSVQNQHNGIPFVQQIEGVKSNLNNV